MTRFDRARAVGRMASTFVINPESRAVDAWLRITSSPTSIELVTDDGVTRAAQTLRLESSESVSTEDGRGGIAAKRQIILFGVKDHPDSAVADTIIVVGDMFSIDGMTYRVRDVTFPPGEMQARAEQFS